MSDNIKKLVVYFSYTNHTKKIAEDISKKLNCDILEIKPLKPYSSNYDKVVNEEQNKESAKNTPKIEKINTDLSQYDEIIIGTPVWWYTLAPVIRTFLKENDLKNKVVVPFATNAGWLGQTFKEFHRLCPHSKVQNEMDIVFTTDYSENKLVTSQQDIDNWINLL